MHDSLYFISHRKRAKSTSILIFMLEDKISQRKPLRGYVYFQSTSQNSISCHVIHCIFWVFPNASSQTNKRWDIMSLQTHVLARWKEINSTHISSHLEQSNRFMYIRRNTTCIQNMEIQIFQCKYILEFDYLTKAVRTSRRALYQPHRKRQGQGPRPL